MNELFQKLGLMLLPLLVLASATTAQEIIAVETGWSLEEQCLGEPTTPPDNWTYEGTIFTRGSGVHAIRADIATPYYVAFSGDSEFGNRGTLSPDGRWFAVPAGQTSRNAMGLASVFDIREIRVFSTDGRRELHRIRGVGQTRNSMSAIYAIASPQWIDSEHLIYYVYGHSGPYSPPQFLVINPFTQETTPWQAHNMNPLRSIPSPDRTRAIYPVPGRLFEPLKWGLYQLPNEQLVAPLSPLMFDAFSLDWTPDSSAFAALIEIPREENDPYSGALILFDRDGEQTDSLIQLRPQLNQFSPTLRFSPDGQFLAFSRFRETDLLIADIANKSITAKCIDGGVNGLAWSPDGRQLAFTYDRNVVILELETNESHTVAYNIGGVFDWKSTN